MSESENDEDFIPDAKAEKEYEQLCSERREMNGANGRRCLLLV